MTLEEKEQFRITAWPGLRLPQPPLLTSGEFRIESGVLVPEPTRQPSARTVRSLSELATDDLAGVGEIYLELARISLEDEEAILGFVNRFRTLGVRHAGFAAFADFPGFEEVVRPDLLAAWPAQHESLGLELSESLEDFRFGARCVRDLVRAVQIVRGGESVDAWESLPVGHSWLDPSVLAAYEEHGMTASPEEEASAALARLVTPALREFQPKLLPFELGMSREEQLLPILLLPLYSICCLELYNHFVDEASYKRCANESCGKLFVRQHGRATAGQHRSLGVMYCSPSCAKAQAQREYRRRVKAQSKEPTTSRRGSSSERATG